MPRELSNPLTEEDKEWLRNWNRGDEIPGEDSDDSDDTADDGGEGDSEYESWSNDELRAELRERELPVSGNHADLVQRLDASDAEDNEDD